MSESSIVNDASGGPPENDGAQFAVTAEKWVYGGDALARRDGEIVLIPFLLPGERAMIATESGGGVLRGRVTELLDPSPDRVDAPCPLFEACGGCHYQNATYEKQLAWKREILREQLKRVGKIEYEGEIETLSGEPFGYRNRVQVHIVGGNLGFLERGTHAVVNVETCPISSPEINVAIGALREMMADERFPNFIRSIELFSNGTEIQLNVLTKERPVAKRFFEWAQEVIPGAGAGAIDYHAVGAIFRVSHNSFFQVNRFLIDGLVEAAIGDARGGSAVDLYAGVGLFSLELAKRFPKVTAVESAGGSARDLEFNIERAGSSVVPHRARVEHFLGDLSKTPDFMLADPPRAGLGKEVVRNMIRLKPARISIVSCDPSTLARDLQGLVGNGYRIDKLILADLFPQTYHLETIVHLSRVG
ncbi:MAG: class I SAM-dependent RNA methyltransferase [Bryobacteraceae bacterium]